MALSPDFKDLLAAFADFRVAYVVIGGYAVGFHARPRFTKDIDLWVGEAPDNLARVRSALSAFGAPQLVLDALEHATPDEVVWFGLPPSRIDILQRIPGVPFADAYARRASASWDGVAVNVISRDDLIRAKRAAGRPQDLIDVDVLEEGAAATGSQVDD